MTARRLAAAFLVLCCTTGAFADDAIHPVEERLRREFASATIESPATWSREVVEAGGRNVQSLRARFHDPGSVSEVRLTLPVAYEGPTVFERGSRYIAVAPLASNGAIAEESGPRVIYAGAYADTDAIEVATEEGATEYLLLRDPDAPRSFEYEVVEMAGISALSVQDGAIVFHPAADGELPLRLTRPLVIDASGRRSSIAAEWSMIDRHRVRLTLHAEGLSYPLLILRSLSVPAMTSARREHTASILSDGRIFIAGGRSLSTTYLSSTELYNPITQAFSAGPSLTVARSQHVAVTLRNGTVLLTGGISAAGTYESSAEICSIDANFCFATGSMGAARYGHTATLLKSGKVLIAGGFGSGFLSSAEVYDPNTGAFTATAGGMSVARWGHTATLLPDGKVLIAGGKSTASGYLASADIYDPATNAFTATSGVMPNARALHTATLLATGKVLVAGGLNGTVGSLSATELYDTTTRTFASSGALGVARYSHTATLRPDGKVFFTGGEDNSQSALTSTAIYDPTPGTCSAGSDLGTARYTQTATLTANGLILIAGGYNGFSKELSSVELFDPAAATQAFTGSLGTARVAPQAVQLLDGRVLVAGGRASATALNSAELYDYTTGTFSATGSMAQGAPYGTATLLADGSVLVVGRGGAERYRPSTADFVATTGPIATPREAHTATLLGDGSVVIAGGFASSQGITSTQIYSPATDSFTNGPYLNHARYQHASALFDQTNVNLDTPGVNLVLVTGGIDSANGYEPIASAEVISPELSVAQEIAPMNVARAGHTATRLQNGDILVVGGGGLFSPATATAEVYRPGVGWTLVGSMSQARFHHTATMLPDGRVLISGGQYNTNSVNTQEVYDPATGTFSPMLTLLAARTYAASSALPNGKVLIIGGENSNPIAACELFDPGRRPLASRAPLLTSVPATASVPASSLQITGAGFEGDSESGSGATNSSAGNVPVLFMQRVDGGEPSLVSSTAHTDSSIAASLFGQFGGAHRVWVSTNSVASVHRFMTLSVPAPNAVAITPSDGPVSGGQTVKITGENLLGPLVVRVGGVAVPVVANDSSSVTFLTPSSGGPGHTTARVYTHGGFSGVGYDFVGSSIASPSNFVATATSTTSVDTSWSAVPGASKYEVFRALTAGTFTLVGSTTSTTFTDTSAPSARALLYKVRAFDSSNVAGMFSAPDLASTWTFTDDPLVPGTTIVKAQHLSQLRNAVNSLLVFAGFFDQGTYTDPSPAPGAIAIKAVHITELRNKLNFARSALGLPTLTFTDPTLTPGVTAVKAIHFTELRNGVK